MRKIGIIYGGRSTEHDASLKSKENFCDNLDKTEFEIVNLVFVDRDGNTYFNNDKITIGELIDKIKYDKDIAYLNLLHGQEGEDGSWSGIFDICDGIGTFESVYTSSVLMNKYAQSANVSFTIKDVLIPETILINKNYPFNLEDILSNFKNNFVIVKPNNMGASHFVLKKNKDDVEGISKLINQIFEYDDEVVIQDFIKGEEYTCGVMNYNNEIITLPIIHARPKADILDHRVKHNSGNIECDFDYFNEKERVEDISIKIFKLFKIKGMCRFDFLITEDGKIYYLEGNLIPGFSKESSFPMMLKEANINLTDFTSQLFNAYDFYKQNSKYLPYHID